MRLSFFSRAMDVPLLLAGRRRRGTVCSRSLIWMVRIKSLLSFFAIGYDRRCCNRIPVHKVGGTMGFVKAVAVSRLSCGMLARIPGGDRGIFGSHSIHRRMISLQSNCIREHNSYGRRLNVLHWGLLPFNLNAGKHSFPPSIERNETSAISFIKGGMKHHAMKLHTKSQAPAEGQGPKKEGTKKFTKWLPTRSNYLQVGQTIDWLGCGLQFCHVYSPELV